MEDTTTLETPACWLLELDRELRIIGITESVPGGPRSPFENDLPLGVDLLDAINVHNTRRGQLAAKLAAGDEVKSFRYALNTEFHGRRCYDLSSTPLYEAGALAGHRCCVIDITALLRMNELHSRSETTLESAFNAYPNFLIVKDIEGRYIRLNEAARELLANWTRDPIGRTPSECLPPKIAAQLSRDDNLVLRTEEARDVEHQILLEDGLHTFLTTKFPIFDRDNCIVGLGASGLDITARKKLESELDQMANYDELTDLPNRRNGRARLNEAVTWAQHIGGRVGFVIVDIDHFKTINDTLGHDVGDQLLIEAAWRLRGCTDDGDTLMRLSGDEFGLVLGQHENSRDVDWVVAAIVEAFEAPFLIEGHELFVGVNIGSATYPDDADGPEQLLRSADLALYAAKRSGLTYSKFDNEIRASVHRSAQISGLLRKALQRREFILHYQPLVEASTREIVGAEALIRWNSQELGFVGPNHFIPVAEETGLIVPIGEWALEQACRDAAAWNRGASRPLSVAVNISPKQLLAPGFHQIVADTLVRTGLSPELLKIEITESSLASDVDTCRRIIDALREMGIVLALDDFGTGYSALSYLQRFKFDILKLDQSFVRKTERGTSGAALTAAIIQMAKSLGMRTVGEGVETNDHVDLLQESGCDLMQGYLFSRPVKNEDFLALAGGATSQAA